MRKVESLINDCSECPYSIEKDDRFLKCVHPKTDKNKIEDIDLFNYNVPKFCPLEKYIINPNIKNNQKLYLCNECANLFITLYGEYCMHPNHNFRQRNFPKVCPIDKKDNIL